MLRLLIGVLYISSRLIHLTLLIHTVTVICICICLYIHSYIHHLCRYSDAYFLEDQDMFNLSGIFRDVSVYSLPRPVHICDYQWISQTVDNNTSSASVEVVVKCAWDIHALASIFASDPAHEGSYR